MWFTPRLTEGRIPRGIGFMEDPLQEDSESGIAEGIKRLRRALDKS
jgi:hypothetical protein